MKLRLKNIKCIIFHQPISHKHPEYTRLRIGASCPAENARIELGFYESAALWTSNSPTSLLPEPVDQPHDQSGRDARSVNQQGWITRLTQQGPDIRSVAKNGRGIVK